MAALDDNLSRLTEDIRTGACDRRTVLRRALAIGMSAPVVAGLLAACGGDDDDGDEVDDTEEGGTDDQQSAEPTATSTTEESDQADIEDEPTEESEPDEPEETSAPEEEQPSGAGFEGAMHGGTLRVILPSDPPTLDMPFTVFNVVGAVVWNIFETLYAYDDDFQLIPMLVESDELSDDQLTHTIHLRQGVLFHSGDEMIADDVVASIKRWLVVAGFAAPLAQRTEDVVAADDYTVEIRLTEPFGAMGHILAMNNGACPIYPASIAEAAGEEQISEFIGTGPYKFVEWQPDRFIRLERFEDYSALPGEPNGYGGHKYAFADEIVFTPITDEAARVAGLRAGDYDFLRDVSPDHYETLNDDPNVEVEILPIPANFQVIGINFESPPMDNDLLRQAIQAALDAEPVLITALGEGFYRLDGSLMPAETAWYSESGLELYNQADPDRARDLLAESGYDGTPLELVVGNNIANQATVVAQQLEAVGITVDLQALETSARNSRVQTTNDWHMTMAGYGFKPDPTQIPITQMCPFSGHWCDADSIALVDTLYAESDFDVRYEAWSNYQQNFYEQVPYVMFGFALQIQPRTSNLKGQFVHTAVGVTFWNMWFDE